MTVKTDNREVVNNLFKKRYTAYDINKETGIGFKEIYHYGRENEMLKQRHKKAIRERQEESQNDKE